MMQERPIIRNKKAAHLSLLLMIAAVLAFAFARFAGNGAFLVQALGILSAAVGISMLIRYVLTDYLYSIENGHFTVHKINGKKSVWVADIALSDFSSLPLTPKEFQKKTETDGKIRVFPFIKNLDAPDEYYLCCQNGGDEYALRLELTEPFLSALISEIEHAKTARLDESDE